MPETDSLEPPRFARPASPTAPGVSSPFVAPAALQAPAAKARTRGQRAALQAGIAADRLAALLLVVALLMVMWAVEAVNYRDGGALDRYGVRSRVLSGLEGVVLAPFIHGSYTHLRDNSLPFLILGVLVALAGLKKLVTVFVVSAVLSGLGLWLLMPLGTDVIGASGVVFGFAGYLISRGFFTHRPEHHLIGVAVIGLYGTALAASIFLAPPQVSWQGHVYGLLAGVLAARLLEGSRAENGLRRGFGVGSPSRARRPGALR